MKVQINPFNECGLFLSYQCSSQCQHCSYVCNGTWQEWLEPDDATIIFEELNGCIRDSWYFHFTGGEPFLNFPRLLEIVSIASKARIPFNSIETNASWCMNEESVREKLTTLQEAGITNFLISSTPYHSEFIPQQRVLLAQKVAKDVFDPNRGFVLIYLEDCLDKIAAISLSDVIPLSRYIEKYGKDSVFSCFPDKYKLAMSGRAAYSDIVDYVKKFPTSRFKGQICGYELFKSGHIHIDPYGNTFPNLCAGISLGDAKEMGKWFFDFDYSHYPLLKILSEEGPYGLLLFAEKEHNYQVSSEGYYDKCHLCVDLRRHIIENGGIYNELGPLNYYNQLIQLHKERNTCFKKNISFEVV